MKRLTAKIKPPPSSVADLEYDESKLFRSVFAGAAGERVLEIILDKLCGIHGPLHADANPTRTSYNIGRRDVGINIARLVYADELSTPTVNRERQGT